VNIINKIWPITSFKTINKLKVTKNVEIKLQRYSIVSKYYILGMVTILMHHKPLCFRRIPFLLGVIQEELFKAETVCVKSLFFYFRWY